MCLITKQFVLDEVKTGPVTFTAYKVYHKVRSTLYSPHNRMNKHGELIRPGTYEASEHIPETCTKYSLTPLGVTHLPAPESISIPASKADDNFGLDITGFHVIATKKEAELYRDQLQKQFQNEAKIMHPEQAEILKDAEFIVVPVQVNKEDVYAAGTTPFGDAGYLSHEVKTYVTRKMTITDEDMTQATDNIWANGQWAGYKNPRDENFTKEDWDDFGKDDTIPTIG